MNRKQQDLETALGQVRRAASHHKNNTPHGRELGAIAERLATLRDSDVVERLRRRAIKSQRRAAA